MDASAIQAVIGAIPGGGIAALAIWALIRKDNQCNALMERLVQLTEKQVTSNQSVCSSIDALREAVRQGTRV